MTRRCIFIFRTTPSPFNFKVSGFFMIAHLQLFQILLLFHNRLWNANTVTELAIWKIIVLIFTRASTVVNTLILHTDASETSLLQEQRFILDGSLFGNGHQQPRRCFSHMSKLVLEYWTILQLIFHHHLTLYMTGGKWWSSTSLKVTSSDTEPQPTILDSELQAETQNFKWDWATTYHTRFTIVALNMPLVGG